MCSRRATRTARMIVLIIIYNAARRASAHDEKVKVIYSVLFNIIVIIYIGL